MAAPMTLLLLAALLPASAKKKGGRRCWGPRPCGATPPLPNATKDAVRALCVAHAWPGVSQDAIDVQPVALKGMNAEALVATAPNGSRLVARLSRENSTTSRCGDWRSCDAVERAAAAAGCAPAVYFSDASARLSEAVDVPEARPGPESFGRLVACVHRAAQRVAVDGCVDVALRSLAARNKTGEAAPLRNVVGRLAALGRTALASTNATLHFDLHDRNVMRRGGEIVAIDFESACAGAPALDLAHPFRRHRRASLGPPSELPRRSAVVVSYAAAAGLDGASEEDMLWDLEIANVLGLALQPHGPNPPGEARAVRFAAQLADLLAGAADSPARRRDVVAGGVTELFHKRACAAARAVEWRGNKCVPTDARRERDRPPSRRLPLLT